MDFDTLLSQGATAAAVLLELPLYPNTAPSPKPLTVEELFSQNTEGSIVFHTNSLVKRYVLELFPEYDPSKGIQECFAEDIIDTIKDRLASLLAAYWFPNRQCIVPREENYLFVKRGKPISDMIVKLTDVLLLRVPAFPSLSQSASMSPSRYLDPDPFGEVPFSPFGATYSRDVRVLSPIEEVFTSEDISVLQIRENIDSNSTNQSFEVNCTTVKELEQVGHLVAQMSISSSLSPIISPITSKVYTPPPAELPDVPAFAPAPVLSNKSK
jgi:hypothetical protein